MLSNRPWETGMVPLARFSSLFLFSISPGRTTVGPLFLTWSTISATLALYFSRGMRRAGLMTITVFAQLFPAHFLPVPTLALTGPPGMAPLHSAWVRSSTIRLRPAPLYPPNARKAPCSATEGSLVGLPSPSTATPGGSSFPAALALITPKRVVAAVAMSRIRGPLEGPGTAKHIGFVPNTACLPPTGATISGEPAMTRAMKSFSATLWA
mmetsp:Transcript_18278/g.44439  ORF Transcript_18278/g.44439 Transcript_18278/m.44439 type:complete len:210 (+) Transcript_18278:158-787(+)